MMCAVRNDVGSPGGPSRPGDHSVGPVVTAIARRTPRRVTPGKVVVPPAVVALNPVMIGGPIRGPIEGKGERKVPDPHANNSPGKIYSLAVGSVYDPSIRSNVHLSEITVDSLVVSRPIHEPPRGQVVRESDALVVTKRQIHLGRLEDFPWIVMSSRFGRSLGRANVILFQLSITEHCYRLLYRSYFRQ